MRAKDKPSRERTTIRKALSKIGLRYMEAVPFWNPYATGARDNQDGGMVWLDFCVWSGKRMFVVMFNPYYAGHGLHEYQKRSYKQKRFWLDKRQIPVLIVPRNSTTQVYEFLIRKFIHKEGL